MKFLRIAPAFLFLLSCSHSSPFLSADLVSMTRYGYSGGGLVDAGPVNERFCYRETPVYGRNKSTGIMDEVIYKAQKKAQADYIANASFTYVEWHWGHDCIQLEGEALRKAVHQPIPGHRGMASAEEPWESEDIDSVAPAETTGPSVTAQE